MDALVSISGTLRGPRSVALRRLQAFKSFFVGTKDCEANLEARQRAYRRRLSSHKDARGTVASTIDASIGRKMTLEQ